MTYDSRARPPSPGTRRRLRGRNPGGLRERPRGAQFGQDTGYAVLTITTTAERLGRLLCQSRSIGTGHLFRHGTTLSELFTAEEATPVWSQQGLNAKETLQGIMCPLLDAREEPSGWRQ